MENISISRIIFSINFQASEEQCQHDIFDNLGDFLMDGDVQEESLVEWSYKTHECDKNILKWCKKINLI